MVCVPGLGHADEPAGVLGWFSRALDAIRRNLNAPCATCDAARAASGSERTACGASNEILLYAMSVSGTSYDCPVRLAVQPGVGGGEPVPYLEPADREVCPEGVDWATEADRLFSACRAAGSQLPPYLARRVPSVAGADKRIGSGNRFGVGYTEYVCRYEAGAVFENGKILAIPDDMGERCRSAGAMVVDARAPYVLGAVESLGSAHAGGLVAVSLSSGTVCQLVIQQLYANRWVRGIPQVFGPEGGVISQPDECFTSESFEFYLP